jgi:hypothetical protein
VHGDVRWGRFQTLIKDKNIKTAALIGLYLSRLARSLYIPQTALLTVDFEPHNSRIG